MHVNITTKRIWSIVLQFKVFKCSTFLYMNSNRPRCLSFRLLRILFWGVKGYVRYLLQCIENIFIGRQQKVLVLLLRILSYRYNCTNIVKYIKKKHAIFTNLRHITTKTTSSIKATPEPAPITIYVVCSIPVKQLLLWRKKQCLSKLNLLRN